MFRVSFAQHNVLIGDELWLFPKAHRDRFEWIALLAYRRATLSHDGGWVSLDDIARLPRWTGKPRRHIRDNVARYLRDIERIGVDVLEVKSGLTGPYRLTEVPTEVSFDLPLDDVERELRIAPLRPEVHRDDLVRFVLRFVRAELFFQQGKLISTSAGVQSQNAHTIFTDLVNDFPANPRLRLIGLLAAVRVQFRVGRFQSAHKTLIQHESLVQQAKDTVLEAQYYLSLAWSYRRAESGTQSNRLVEATLSKARKCASDSGDRGCLGLLAYRTAWSLARKARYEDALSQMAFAVEAALITLDIMALQAYCADLGSIIHRMGPSHYREARRWILTGILLARWARLGRDDAHGEMILGKMYCEVATKQRMAELWLKRAERIALSAGNAVNLADIHMVRAFWHRQYGSRKDVIETLGKALIEFRGLRNFDSRQKELYIMRKFPSLWFQVLAFAKAHAQDTF